MQKLTGRAEYEALLNTTKSLTYTLINPEEVIMVSSNIQYYSLTTSHSGSRNTSPPNTVRHTNQLSLASIGYPSYL
jgi:hypothetical protein